ncbi:hypothetical protein SAMN02745134_03789 [Clostridium acidisoli DSM 12555]|uniref:Uncharacterized protein n=1 Tax=Clostridium acidisoli DSM 12555 TaxID=1121291 RepID=A0A1W1XYU3_9CLOT|nr:hypothetical protein [Clostridium acidisoli]SMC29140.1 hypothetical protein SAMN02745134_03789 [Clostridium acidisoli DSM 12555]
MNINELENKIHKLGLDTYKYNLGNMPMRELELGLIRENNKWIVYQSYEKGGYNIIKTFDNEDEACDLILYFLKLEKKKETLLNS